MSAAHRLHTLASRLLTAPNLTPQGSALRVRLDAQAFALQPCIRNGHRYRAPFPATSAPCADCGAPWPCAL